MRTHVEKSVNLENKITQKTRNADTQLKPINLLSLFNCNLSVKITTTCGISTEKLCIISDSTEHAVLFIYIELEKKNTEKKGKGKRTES